MNPDQLARGAYRALLNGGSGGSYARRRGPTAVTGNPPNDRSVMRLNFPSIGAPLEGQSRTSVRSLRVLIAFSERAPSRTMMRQGDRRRLRYRGGPETPVCVWC